MKNESILFSEMIPEPEWEGEFNDWYDSEHIPLRMAVPGFTGAQRYRNTEGPEYLAVYTMESGQVLNSGAYREVKENPSALTRRMLDSVSGFTRQIGALISVQQNDTLAMDPIQAPFLYSVLVTVPEPRHDEYNDWYTTDHVPLLLKNKSWLAVHRYHLADSHPEPFTHLAIHYLNDGNALDSEELQAARTTEWRERLSRESWFKESYKMFFKIGDRFGPE